MHAKVLFITTALLLALALSAPAKSDFDHGHQEFDRILGSFVKDGQVDYAGLHLGRKPLQRYLKGMGSISEREYNQFTRSQKMAYWINFYNAATLDVISRNLPKKDDEQTLDTAREIDGLWTSFKWNTPFGLRNLNSMEFDFLRSFRGLFWPLTINRGSVGGGLLSSKAYTAARVREQIEQTATAWLAKPANFNVDVENEQLQVSEYLDRYFVDLKHKLFTRGEFLGHSERENVYANLYLRFGRDEKAKQMLRKGVFSLVILPHVRTLNALAGTAH
jgi:hypothetical protein